MRAPQSGATEARIIAAARELIAQQGFAATTMQEIVSAAGTSIGNAYFYFDNKQHLLERVVSVVAQDHWRKVDRYMVKLESNEEKAAAGIYLNTLPTVAGMIREIKVRDGVPDHVVMDAFQRLLHQHYAGVMARIFPDEPQQVRDFILHAWIGTGRSIAIARLTGATQTPAGELVRRAVQFNLRAVGYSKAQLLLADHAVDDIERLGLARIYGLV